MKVVIYKQDRINYILDGLCDYYGITRDELNKPVRKLPQKALRKKIATHLLWYVADCKLKDIAIALGYSDKMLYHFGDMRDEIGEMLESDKSFKTEYSQILKHLNL